VKLSYGPEVQANWSVTDSNGLDLYRPRCSRSKEMNRTQVHITSKNPSLFFGRPLPDQAAEDCSWPAKRHPDVRDAQLQGQDRSWSDEHAPEVIELRLPTHVIFCTA